MTAEVCSVVDQDEGKGERERERERERGREKGGERGKKGRKTKDDPFSLNKLYHCPGLIHHLAKHNTAY